VRAALAPLAGTALALVAAPSPASAQTCIKGDSYPETVAIEGGKVGYCLGEDKQRACYATDLATGKTAAAPARTAPAPKVVLKENGDALSACSPDGKACKALKPRFEVDPGLGLFGRVNDAGTRAAAISSSSIEIFDLSTGKRIASFVAGKRYACSDVDFLGEALLVHSVDCGEAHVGASWIATDKGKRIADVGGKPVAIAARPAPLADARWIFLAQSGDALWIQDIKTGAVKKRISLGPADPESLPALAANATHAAVVFGGKRAGTVAVVELATDKVQRFTAPRCP
jgi:hypothetical protein